MKSTILDWLVGDDDWWRAKARSFMFFVAPFVLLIALFLSVGGCAGGEA